MAVTSTTVATFNAPSAMTFLPDGRLLVTERTGRLYVVTEAGSVGTPITGSPVFSSQGQGGLIDVALDPAFASNNRVYLSFTEGFDSGSRLAVSRATLAVNGAGDGTLLNIVPVWRQFPSVSGNTVNVGGRMAFSPDGFLYVTAGDRGRGADAQRLDVVLGKIIRITPDGNFPADNPFTSQAVARREIWTIGHRNPQGLVFASDGRLFSSEHGPTGGDEFNLITRGQDYGWRTVSEGDDGEVLPRHASRPIYTAPLLSWTPAIAPSGMIQYTGTRFIGWNGDFILAGLLSQGLVRVRVNGNAASEQGRIPLGARIREVEQGPDGAIWVLEDGPNARLRKLVPS